MNPNTSKQDPSTPAQPLEGCSISIEVQERINKQYEINLRLEYIIQQLAI